MPSRCAHSVTAVHRLPSHWRPSCRTWEYGLLADALAGYEHELVSRTCPEPNAVTASAVKNEYAGEEVAECLQRCRSQHQDGDRACAAVAVRPAGEVPGSCQLLPSLPDGCLPLAVVKAMYGKAPNFLGGEEGLDDLGGKAVVFARAELLSATLPGGAPPGWHTPHTSLHWTAMHWTASGHPLRTLIAQQRLDLTWS